MSLHSNLMSWTLEHLEPRMLLAATYPLEAYFPLQVGNRWVYHDNLRGINGIREVIESIDLDGAAVASLQDRPASDSNAFRDDAVSFFSNAEGLQLFEQRIDPQVGAELRIDYDPAVQLLPENLQVGARTQSSGSAYFDIGDGLLTFFGTYQFRFSVEKEERVQVPAGTYDTLKVVGTRSVQGSSDVLSIETSETIVWYMAEGIGIVKESQDVRSTIVQEDGTSSDRQQSEIELLEFETRRPTQDIYLAWNQQMPKEFYIDSGEVRMRDGTMPLSVISMADRLQIEAGVRKIFSNSGVENIEFVNAPTSDSTDVYFTDWPSRNWDLRGIAYSGVDRFNNDPKGSVAVFLSDRLSSGEPGRNLEMDSMIVAHEIGHTLGLRHINVPGSTEVMDYQFKPGVPEQFYNQPTFVVEPPLDSTRTSAGFTHNPLYHLRRYVDGRSQADLEAEGLEPGQWDVNPLAEYNHTFTCSGVDRMLYRVVLAAGIGDALLPVAAFDQVPLSQLAALQYRALDGTTVRLSAASAADGPLDIFASMDGAIDSGRNGFTVNGGSAQARLDQFDSAGVPTSIGTVAVSGVLVDDRPAQDLPDLVLSPLGVKAPSVATVGRRAGSAQVKLAVRNDGTAALMKGSSFAVQLIARNTLISEDTVLVTQVVRAKKDLRIGSFLKAKLKARLPGALGTGDYALMARIVPLTDLPQLSVQNDVIALNHQIRIESQFTDDPLGDGL